MSRVLAIDPGPHTGVAWFENGELHSLETVQPDQDIGRQWQFRRLHSLLLALDRSRTTEVAPVLVVENFRTVRLPGPDSMETIKLLGFLEGIAIVRDLPVILQMPSEKVAWKEQAIRLIHESMPGYRPTPHEFDAVCHGLAYYYRAGKVALCPGPK